MQDILIKDVVEKSPDKKHLLIVTFQNGALVHAKRKQLSIDSSNDADKNTKRVKITTDTGHVYSGLESKGDGFRSFMVIRKRGRAEAKMIEVGSICMKNEALVRKPKPSILPDESLNVRDKAYVDLQRRFGAKKHVRRLEQREKMKLDVSAVEQSLSETIKDMEVSKLDISMDQHVADSLSTILPPCNRDVKDITKVYVLEEILGDELFSECQKMVESMLEEGKENFASSMCPLAGKMWEEALKKGVKEDAAIAIFVTDCIIKFYNSKLQRTRDPRYKLSGNQLIDDKIVQLFSVRNGPHLTRPQSMRDKALCYAVTMIFIGNNFKLPMDSLAKEVNSSVKKLAVLCKVLGGVPADSKFELKLKIPIPKPPSMKLSKSGSVFNSLK